MQGGWLQRAGRWIMQPGRLVVRVHRRGCRSRCWRATGSCVVGASGGAPYGVPCGLCGPDPVMVDDPRGLHYLRKCEECWLPYMRHILGQWSSERLLLPLMHAAPISPGASHAHSSYAVRPRASSMWTATGMWSMGCLRSVALGHGTALQSTPSPKLQPLGRASPAPPCGSSRRRRPLSLRYPAPTWLEAATATAEPVPGFLAGLRALADERRIVLIFDEIITGMRWSGVACSLTRSTPLFLQSCSGTAYSPVLRCVRGSHRHGHRAVGGRSQGGAHGVSPGCGRWHGRQSAGGQAGGPISAHVRLSTGF